MEVEVFELVVFNRRGMLVWQTVDASARWDGTDTGRRPLPQGAYVYRYYIRSTTGRA